METSVIPQHKRIGILFSGGADSTLMLYQLSKTHPDSEFYLYVGSRLDDGQYHLDNCNNILNELKLNNIKAYAIYTFKDRAEGKANRDKLRKQFFDYHNLDCFINGFTRNPSECIGEGEDQSRNKQMEKVVTTPNGLTMYRPLADLDKKGVAKLYKEYDILDSLFPLTISCEAKQPPRPCKECWWCKERHWAFGEY